MKPDLISALSHKYGYGSGKLHSFEDGTYFHKDKIPSKMTSVIGRLLRLIYLIVLE